MSTTVTLQRVLYLLEHLVAKAANFPADVTEWKYAANSADKLVLLTLMSVISLSDKSFRIFNFNFTGACEQTIQELQLASKHTYHEAIN